MKKVLVGVLLFFFAVAIVYGQAMTDDQIISYVKEQNQNGVSQKQIAEDLLKRGVTPSQLQNLKRQYENRKVLASKPSDNDASSVRENPIEGEVSSEVFDEIQSASVKQVFGRNIFNNKNLSFEPDINIPTPMNYRLGPGDEVVIEVWGASEMSVRQKISPEGNLNIEHLGVIYLNGLTVEDANDYLRNKFGNVFAGVGDGSSQIRLTVGQIRTMQINIWGEVVVPGTYTISSLSSVFHALYRAGGVNNIGSLRSIEVYRAGKLLKVLDVYKYILDGKTTDDIRLTDGDVIIVSPYDRLVNISGEVKRPMHYEMTKKETVADLINYSGGFTGDAYKKSLQLVRQTGDKNKIFTINDADFSTFNLSDGDLLVISSGLGLFENRVEIKGAVYREGFYEIGEQIKTVKQLIDNADGLRGDAFLNRAVLIREKEDLTKETIPVDLKSLISGSKADIPLKKNDILYIPSNSDLTQERSFTIHGQIPRPGTYKYSDNTTLEDLIIQAGGLLESASMIRVDIARRIIDPYSVSVTPTLSETYTFTLKDGFIVDGDVGFILKPYDEVYVRRSPGYHVQQNVFLEGELLFPGTYALNRKTERISDIVKRAGNITQDAYPKGARLIRQRTPDEMLRQQTTLKIATQQSGDSIALNTLDIASQFNVGIELHKALANPGSDYDLVLRAGDRLVIPEYNNTVKINGAVMYPNTVLFKKGEKLSHYINQSGGYTVDAKKNRAFVVYMNGTVSQAKGSDKDVIQPGCEIVVPTKEQSRKMSLPEVLAVSSAAISMISVVALLINALSK